MKMRMRIATTILLGSIATLSLTLNLTAPSSRADTAASVLSGKQPDWNGVNAEALDYFRHYLQFDTSNPPGDTSAAIAYLKQILDREVIPTETFVSAPGKVTLVARVPGPDGVKPLLLMSHAD